MGCPGCPKAPLHRPGAEPGGAQGSGSPTAAAGRDAPRAARVCAAPRSQQWPPTPPPALSPGRAADAVPRSGASPQRGPWRGRAPAPRLGLSPARSHLVSMFFPSSLQSCNCFTGLSHETQQGGTKRQSITLL